MWRSQRVHVVAEEKCLWSQWKDEWEDDEDAVRKTLKMVKIQMRDRREHNEQLRRSVVLNSLCIIKYINSISLHFTQIYTLSLLSTINSLFSRILIRHSQCDSNFWESSSQKHISVWTVTWASGAQLTWTQWTWDAVTTRRLSHMSKSTWSCEDFQRLPSVTGSETRDERRRRESQNTEACFCCRKIKTFPNKLTFYKQHFEGNVLMTGLFLLPKRDICNIIVLTRQLDFSSDSPT